MGIVVSHQKRARMGTVPAQCTGHDVHFVSSCSKINTKVTEPTRTPRQDKGGGIFQIVLCEVKISYDFHSIFMRISFGFHLIFRRI